MMAKNEVIFKNVDQIDTVEENQPEREDEIDEFSDDELNMENSTNPFTTNGKWTTESLEKVTAIIPRYDKYAEITSNSLKKRKPNLRFWMAPIQFSEDNYQSDVIRVEDVKIPYSQETGYGTKFVYICLPESLRSLLKNSKFSDNYLNIDETNLIGPGGWWKIVTSIGNKLGYVGGSDMSFSPLSLQKYFEENSKGLKATLNLRFVCKASTDRSKELDDSVRRNLNVEVLQGYITSLDEDINQPFRPSPTVPKPLEKDITPDEIKNQFFKMGLLKELRVSQKPMADHKLCKTTNST